MSKINNGRPAFPNPGMSLRDYFAAAALQGSVYGASNSRLSPDSEMDNGETVADIAAKTSYQFADAMLKAREDKQ